MLRVAKQVAISLYRQLHAHKNLYHIRDRRTFAPWIAEDLVRATEAWADVLPWPPRTVLDVGAHDGEISGQLSCLFRPAFVGLVEPLPQMAKVLRSRSFASRQLVFECALGSQSGEAILNVLASLPSSSLLEPAEGLEALFHRPMEQVQSVQVPIRTLDSVFEECRLDQLDLLKIDVQGYELQVFQGGLRTLAHTRMVVTEVSFFEHYLHQPQFVDIYVFLRGQGFELLRLFGHLLDANGRPLQCDAVFVNSRLS